MYKKTHMELQILWSFFFYILNICNSHSTNQPTTLVMTVPTNNGKQIGNWVKKKKIK